MNDNTEKELWNPKYPTGMFQEFINRLHSQHLLTMGQPPIYICEACDLKPIPDPQSESDSRQSHASSAAELLK